MASSKRSYRLIITHVFPLSQDFLRGTAYFFQFLEILYLFIRNYNSIIIVWSILGLVCSGRLVHRSLVATFFPSVQVTPFGYETTPNLLGLATSILKRFPAVLIWIGLAALDFSIANQRLPASIVEDRLNKPYRPIASGKISPRSALKLRLAVCLTGFTLSRYMGSQYAFIIQMMTTYCYNDLGGSQGLWIIRDVESAIGLVSWLFGCMSVAGGPDLQYSPQEVLSAVVLFIAMASTVAIQDFRDLEGDRVTGRHTLPIIVGEGIARFLMAASLLLWSFGVPILLGKIGMMTLALNATGVALAMRLIFVRSRGADKRSLEYWYGWFAVLCLVVL